MVQSEKSLQELNFCLLGNQHHFATYMQPSRPAEVNAPPLFILVFSDVQQFCFCFFPAFSFFCLLAVKGPAKEVAAGRRCY